MRQGLKNYLRVQRSDVLIEFISDEKNQMNDIVGEISSIIVERNNKEDMIALASVVKGSNLEKIKRIAIDRKDIDFIVRLATVPNMDWNDLEDAMIAILLEKQKRRDSITNDELYMATIFYKNILDADISKIENIMLQSENYSAMACFVSNVPGAHIEKFEQVVLATGRVRVLRQWKELVEFVSPRFDRKLEELEHDFNKNINFLKNCMEHNEETDERWQTVERISSEIFSSKKAEQPAKPPRQKLFPFWKRK